MRAHGPARSLLLAAPVGFLSWLGLLATELGSRVEIESDASSVSLTVDGTRLDAPLVMDGIEGIRIEAPRSVLPLGATELRVEPAAGEPVTIELPRRFRLPGGGPRGPGDWYVEGRDAGKAVVLERSLDVQGPFRIRARLLGRSYGRVGIVLLAARPVSFEVGRGLVRDEIAIVAAGEPAQTEPLTVSSATRVKGLAAVLLQGGVAASLLVAVFSLLALAAGGAAAPAGESGPRPRGGPGAPGEGLFLPALGITGLAYLGLALWVAGSVLEKLPHLQDELCYLLRARWLLAGEIAPPVPEVWRHLRIPYTSLEAGEPVAGERWRTIYPVGWSLFLAPGEAVGGAWVISPLMGLATLLGAALLARQVHGTPAALVTLLLVATSPLGVLLGASYLSHAAASALLVWCLYLVITGSRRGSPFRLGWGGLLLGLAFGVRPLTALVVGAALLAFLMLGGEPAGGPLGPRVRRLLWLCLGGVLGTLPTLLDNAYVTGSPLRFAYTTSWSLHHLREGLGYGEPALSLVPALGFGWAWAWGPLVLPLGFGLALVPCLLGRARRTDLLLLGSFGALVLAYLGHRGTGIHGYGPRFYHDLLWGLQLVAARGVVLLGGLGRQARGHGGGLTREGLGGWLRSLSAPAATLGLAVLLAPLVLVLPRELARYRGYNWVDGGLERAVRAAGLEGALLVIGDTHLDWLRAGNLVGADMDAELVVVSRDGDDADLRRRYPRRPFYEWRDGALAPYRREEPPASLDLLVDRDRGAGAGALRRAAGLAAGEGGRLAVADGGNHRVQLFDAAGVPLGSLGRRGRGAGELRTPLDVAWDAASRLLVLDAGNRRVLVFDAAGHPAGSLAEGRLREPRGIASGGGEVYVADTGNDRILVLGPDGGAERSLGSRGSAPGQLRRPTDAVPGPGGEVYVADTGNGRIQVLEPDGRPRAWWPVAGWEGGMAGDVRLALDARGRLFASDPGGQRILGFDGRGERVWERSCPGPPGGIAALGDGIVVTLRDNVVRYAP